MFTHVLLLVLLLQCNVVGEVLCTMKIPLAFIYIEDLLQERMVSPRVLLKERIVYLPLSALNKDKGCQNRNSQ